MILGPGVFIANSALLGVGLAMDAFSVSLANGLAQPDMRKRKTAAVAFTFAFFQALMPMIGWICVKTVADRFDAVRRLVPWIALGLLLFIGIKMIAEAVKPSEDTDLKPALTPRDLLLQGIATSIDALSVGFAISEYGFLRALAAALIIAAVTFAICLAGVALGKKAGAGLSGKAGILGGVILIAIGLEIFIKGVLL